ncbi:MAG: GNAT family N-acetyltransferase [Oscillospiraceae bacterium]|nr:GNAT family N-acetyltransferase [Oscillospiraceae bacterium]
MTVTLRLETPADHYAVEAMTRDAFWRFWEPDREICEEHLLTHRLRAAGGFVPELNYVALADGELAGHIIYSKSRIERDNGEALETLTFGPLTVRPDMQRKGIGKALMRRTFDEAKRLGYPGVIIFGHPDYYPRVGFRRASEFGITTSDGKSFDALMAYPLCDGALDGAAGKYYIDPVYDTLNQADALAFDQKFPPKARIDAVLIGVLLERLGADAAKAIESLGFQTLELMRSKSRREILALPGMDEISVGTVSAVMAEHGWVWGR